MGNEKDSLPPSPLSKEHPIFKGSQYNVRVEWENGEITEEPLSVITVDAPVACAIYAKEHALLDKPGWRDSREFPSNKEKCSLRPTRQRSDPTSIKPKFKYGVQIP